jgi:LysR family transcriptional regulator, malonate utilization transcriptional regulator
MPELLDEEITFRKLEILLAFLDAGSLGRAAERLDVSAVTVHRALHSLESGMRCALFRHEGRNLVPTEAAQALAEVSQEVLRKMHQGIRITRELAGYAADSIRIGSLYSLTSGAVPALIKAFKLRRPDAQTELVLGSNAELLRRLRDGSVDAALLGDPQDAGDLECQALFEDEVFFAAPAASALAGASSIDLSACREQRFVCLTEGFITQAGFQDAFRRAGFEPHIVMRTGDIFSLMNLVGGGIGCTLLPGRVRTVMPGLVRLVPLQQRFRTRQRIGLWFLRKRERDPNLLALVAACRELAFDCDGVAHHEARAA